MRSRSKPQKGLASPNRAVPGAADVWFALGPLWFAVTFLLAVSPARAQLNGNLVGASSAATPVQSALVEQDQAEFVPPDSPRGSLESFMRLCRSGQYQHAASYLDVPPQKSKRAAELARRWQAVLDHRVSIDLDAISLAPEGSANPSKGGGF